MRILVAGTLPPWPIRGGREIRVYNMILPLRERHEITLVFFEPEEGLAREDLEFMETQFHRVVGVPPPPPVRPRGMLMDILVPSPRYRGAMSSSRAMQRAVDDLCARGGIDVAHIVGSPMLPYFLDAPCPVVFDIVDCMTLFRRNALSKERGAIARLRAVKTWLEARRFEARYFRDFPRKLTTTIPDAEAIRALIPGTRIDVVPNGVDSDYFSPSDDPVNPRQLVFTGVMDYPPNVDAMGWFAREVLPRVRQADPGVSLVVVGRRPAPDVLALQGDGTLGIEVVGEVPDVRPYLRGSAVFVCPMRTGSGIKNKILEAWACGVPVVSTARGSEGIEGRSDDNIVTADTAPEMAEAILGLIADPVRRGRLSAAGRRTAVDQYSWHAMAGLLEGHLEAVIAGS